ncbi:helix-turn-helix domain-containing protein [Butyrivibrio sp. NC2002]|uniref:helix-turn-helix domain-containing protein n=1 Tax=Butyrivibrio sp. NC2002 TaxID=1410610 RepID=UPI00068F7C02|nr:helix-turn-helix domain-containing protein [Butyrivibrio sp. NC2002]
MKTYEKLKEIRKISGMTQEELANKLNVSRQTISKWEKGLSVPDLEMAISFCEVFQISLDDLFKEGKMEKSKTISLEDIIQVNKRNQRNLIMFMSSVFFLLIGLLALIFIFAIRYTTLNIEYILYRAISTGEYANVSLETTPFFIPAVILIAIGGIMLTIELINILKEKKNENI